MQFKYTFFIAQKDQGKDVLPMTGMLRKGYKRVGKYGKKTKLWRKSGEGYGDNEEVYMGSLIDKVGIKTEMKLSTLLMKKNGSEIVLPSKEFKFDDLNKKMTNVNNKGNGVKLIVRVNKELFEIK